MWLSAAFQDESGRATTVQSARAGAVISTTVRACIMTGVSGSRTERYFSCAARDSTATSINPSTVSTCVPAGLDENSQRDGSLRSAYAAKTAAASWFAAGTRYTGRCREKRSAMSPQPSKWVVALDALSLTVIGLIPLFQN